MAGYTADGMIVPEMCALPVTIALAGIMRFLVRVRGRSIHAAQSIWESTPSARSSDLSRPGTARCQAKGGGSLPLFEELAGRPAPDRRDPALWRLDSTVAGLQRWMPDRLRPGREERGHPETGRRDGANRKRPRTHGFASTRRKWSGSPSRLTILPGPIIRS